MLDVESLLEQAGERWRAGQAPPPDVDPRTFTSMATPRLTWLPRRMAFVAAGIVLVVGVAVSLGVGPDLAGRPASCAVTVPNPPFVPAPPAAPAPPVRYDSNWFGSDGLWALLDRDGEVWELGATGLGQKTFWWSAAWTPGDERDPAITVTGTQLDGIGTFEAGPGTHASADFGTAMLVGVQFPVPGCWRLTAEYRDVELSYVVLVTDE